MGFLDMFGRRGKENKARKDKDDISQKNEELLSGESGGFDIEPPVLDNVKNTKSSKKSKNSSNANPPAKEAEKAVSNSTSSNVPPAKEPKKSDKETKLTFREKRIEAKRLKLQKKQDKTEVKRRLAEEKIAKSQKKLDFFAEKRISVKLELIKQKKLKPKAPVALCLGGGGARGFAHIGAIKAFEEAGLDFDFCVGTSAGSIVGALYCAGFSADSMLKHGGAINMKDVRKGPFWSPDDSTKIAKIFTGLAGDINFSDLKKPFYCVAVDMISSREVILDSGSVGMAVAASSTVPLFFKPLEYKNMHLVDGGLLNNIPSDVCRMMGAKYVITVDVNPTRGEGTPETGIISVLKATFSIMGINASYNGIINSDIIIAPDLSAFKSTDKEGYAEMYRLGYEAAKNKIKDIVSLIY